MPSSLVSTFTDPYLYQAAIRAADVTIVPTTPGNFRAERTRVDFPRVWMQRCSESLPVIRYAEIHRQRAPIFFLTEPSGPTIHHGGVEVGESDLVVYGFEASIHHRTVAGCRWGSMSLSPDELAKAGRALVDRELAAPSSTNRMRPSTQLMSRLRRLHSVAGRFAWTAPDVISHPEVARALDESLTHAMIMCLTDGVPSELNRAGHHRLSAMGKLEELLSAHSNHPLYLSEICLATKLSERTLRVFCQEQLGMGPVRYLWLRRMHFARRALLLADANVETVTAVAMAYGFWELGRFSVAYRKLFGETPSASLRRSVDDTAPPRNPFALPVFA